MKLTYIYHSGYAIEGDNFTIIIDYFKDSADDASKGIIHKQLLKNEGKLYVLCTHSHHDHFVAEILDWKEQREDIIYIFSKEILTNLKLKNKSIIYLDKLETYKDDILEIKAFGSTDIGGSFLIETKDRTIFHAGDLNNWHWNEESTAKEIEDAETYYSSELNILTNEVTDLDLAMFPIDPRLGKDYMKGAEQFVSIIKTNIFAPMHFGKAYNKIAAFEKIAKKYSCKSISWKHRGESINF